MAGTISRGWIVLAPLLCCKPASKVALKTKPGAAAAPWLVTSIEKTRSSPGLASFGPEIFKSIFGAAGCAGGGAGGLAGGFGVAGGAFGAGLAGGALGGGVGAASGTPHIT